MNLDERLVGLRSSVALSRLDHVRYLRVVGEGAYEAVNRIFPRELFLRDGQISQGLLLREDGTVFADCALGSDGDEFFMLTEGPGAVELIGYLDRHAGGAGATFVDHGPTHALLSVDGPYAWELLARLIGQEVIGVPYLTFFHSGDLLVYRGGKTGEYGYGIAVPNAGVEALEGELRELGRELDIVEADLETLDLCALESWFFNVRREGRAPVTPLELQLQSRVSRRKAFVGSEALARRRSDGIRQRLTCVVGEGPFAVGDAVSRDDRVIGRVLNAGRSPLRDETIGMALLDLEYAWPGVDRLDVGGSTEARSVSPPVVNNRSLFVNPQVHSYATRLEDDFPPLVRR